MKCQSLFLRKNKQNISKFCLLKFLPSMLRFNRFLIALGFNDTSTLVGYFVSSPEKGRKEIVEEMKERDREERGTGTKVKKQKK